MRVHIVSSTTPGCGIAEHSRLLQEAGAAAGGVEVSAAYLNAPAVPPPCDLLHLNYHRGLHAAWTPAVLAALRAAHPRVAVTLTFHDTYERQPDTLAQDLARICDVTVVHEPCADLHDLRVVYWRQGVPDHLRAPLAPLTGYQAARPWLGTVGWDFPWKNYDALADITAACGWGFLLHLPERPPARRVDALDARNPYLDLQIGQSTGTIVRNLAQCTATAFMYTCANSGTSAAIRLGMAAGRPLFAQQGCRQFRDLQLAAVPGITWTTLECLPTDLQQCPQGWNLPLLAALPHESWSRLGAQYVALWRAAVEKAQAPA